MEAAAVGSISPVCSAQKERREGGGGVEVDIFQTLKA